MRINTFFRQHSFSRSSASSRASNSDHEDDDAITPIEREEKPQQQHVEMRAQQQPASSKPAELDNAVLWRRMLNLQRRYHCYNSARMSAALEDESLEAVVRMSPLALFKLIVRC